MKLKEIEGIYFLVVQPEMYPQGAPVDYSDLQYFLSIKKVALNGEPQFFVKADYQMVH